MMVGDNYVRQQNISSAIYPPPGSKHKINRSGSGGQSEKTEIWYI